MASSFIIPQERLTGSQGREIIINSIDAGNIIAQQIGIDRIEDALIDAGVKRTELPEYQLRDIEDGVFQVNQSMFGTPFIGAIVLAKGNDGDPGQTITSSNDLTKIITLNQVYISTCLIGITQKKNTIRTQLLGRNGTIKTYMNTDDYEITIEATIVSTDDPNFRGNYNGIYPDTIIQDLIAICEAPCMISIASDHLNMFGISYIAIDSYEISQHQGDYSQQKISITAYSDEPSSYKSIINF